VTDHPPIPDDERPIDYDDDEDRPEPDPRAQWDDWPDPEAA
jgi:hypothetical protein